MLLDSVIVIDHLNGVNLATEFIKKNQKAIHLSVITRAEVLAGYSFDIPQEIKDLLDAFPTIAITKQEADLAASLRQQYRWKLPDAFQAAIAVHHKILLVTRNTKDFSPKLPFLLIPYKFTSV